MSTTGFSLDNFLKLINKHGAIAVLAAWLFFNNARLNKLEGLLYDCYKEKRACIDTPIEKPLLTMRWEAVIPEKIKIPSDNPQLES